jgi:glycosyltransferase involved in cell wall biosynthesis
VLEVPWRSVVVIVEVPPAGVLDQLAALGRCSGNRLVAVTHDAIPATSADLVVPEETSKVVRYLAAVKFASRIAGVSASAAAEVAGFVRSLASQGIRGPVVGEVALPAGERRRVDAPPPVGAPSVVVVGSHEPRKNHLAVLHAAELLWREGFDFTLTFIGGSGWGEEFPRRVAELQGVGRPIRVRLAVSDEELSRAYASASFTVFPSLHEGFGLPVAESLSYGTPVITTGYGSTAEIGGAGGCVLVDPRDDAALTGAMRRLLGEPEVLRGLRAQIAQRPVRGWSDYADELWEFLVVPELVALREGGAGDGSFSD